jgi:hypothetical protein
MHGRPVTKSRWANDHSILSQLHELAPARRSLYRAYKIPPAPLSNSYAPMSTFWIEIFKPEIFKPEIFKPSSAKRAERSERIPQDQ